MNRILKNKTELFHSPVVANNSMNRKRQAVGIHSYERDIKLNPIDFLSKKSAQKEVAWLDLCCGEGNALIQAAKHFQSKNQSQNLRLVGIDLVDYFSEFDDTLRDFLTLKEMNLEDWQPEAKYDLITIVHGLHYVGDKIDLIRKAAFALKKDGLLVANLDVKNIVLKKHFNSSKAVKTFFKNQGIDYNSRTNILKIEGFKQIDSTFKYLGADDNAGANYTGQEVVDSVYEVL